MKRIIALLMILMLAVGAVSLTACKKADTKKADQSASAVDNAASIPEDLTPIGTNKDGNPTGYSKVDKDESGRVVRNYTYDSLGKLQGSVEYEYDENDFIVKEIRYNADGKTTSQVAFERNEEGLETKRTESDAQGNVTMVIVTEYNEDGSSTRTKYDANGNVIE